MRIGSREVGPGHPTFLIAELGSNHGGSLDRALALIDAAADAGADAAKLQYFRVDKFLVPRPDPEALRRYELPDEWLPKLVARCGERGIEFLCTAFDVESLDVIDPFVKAHKIGSYEAAVPSFVNAVALKRKSATLISNGITQDERWPDECIVPFNLIPLRCVSKYPANIEDYKLGVYLDASDFEYGDPWGVSDHTLHPTIVPAAATALGACVVEKHMQQFGTPETPDSAVSIDEEQFREMVEAVRLTEKAVRG